MLEISKIFRKQRHLVPVYLIMDKQGIGLFGVSVYPVVSDSESDSGSRMHGSVLGSIGHHSDSVVMQN